MREPGRCAQPSGLCVIWGFIFNWYSGDVSSSKLVGVIGDKVLVGE